MKHAKAKPGDLIIEVIQKITEAPHHGGVPGLAVVVDEDDRVLGVLTDGDIRKAIYRKIDLNRPVRDIMSQTPICVKNDLDVLEIIREANRQMREKNVEIDKVIRVDPDHRLVDIISLQRLYREADVLQKVIAVYGLGFVGLTLALILSENRLFHVVGIDNNQNVIAGLKEGRAPFYEEGLQTLLRQIQSQGNMSFFADHSQVKADVHIISVGTPVDDQGQPVMGYLESCSGQIGSILKMGDLVICRSTVPVGTTRHVVIPLLEQASGLVAGRDFHVAFAPERTVAGQALKELRQLPQVVGGLTSRCAKLCASIFEKITKTIVSVESLEAAEVVKLINNTYRDVVFSFANEVSYLCDRYNIDAFHLIQSANEGYPRDRIPTPSPGVGGICLSKDPYLYSYHTSKTGFSEPGLGLASRNINSRGVDYVIWQFEKFLQRDGLSADGLNAFVMGLAFKGVPETSDCRFASGVELVQKLKNMGCVVSAFDAVLDQKAVEAFGVTHKDLLGGLKDCRAAFLMNNHPDNTRFELFAGINSMRHPAFLFDGFSRFNKVEVESVKGMTYASMGYISHHEKGHL